jgi:hypothetical protein
MNINSTPMNTKSTLVIIFFFLSFFCLHGQTISYTYDNNGNRKTRQLDVQKLRSNSIQFPVVNQKNLREEAVKEKVIEGEMKTVVYPNPTKGLLKIDITNMPLNSKTEAKVYDLNGTEQMSKRNFDSSSELDISRLKDGIYILRIKVNETIIDWKVIKNNR